MKEKYERVIFMTKPKLYIASFSGGKDSTAMLIRLIEEGYPVDKIVFCDTGLEFPEMYDHIKKVEQYIGREITTIRSENDFMYYATEKERTIRSTKIPGLSPGDVVKGYGYPGLLGRWCTKHLKTEVIGRYIRNFKKEYEIIQYVGIAADETHRERDLCYPLIEWGMTESDCLEYCNQRGFDWGGLYDIWDRVSCWCCPLQSLEDLRKLKGVRPGLWSKLKEMDAIISKTDRPNFRHTQSLTDIERRFEVENEFAAAGKKLRTKEFFQTLKDRSINY